MKEQNLSENKSGEQILSEQKLVENGNRKEENIEDLGKKIFNNECNEMKEQKFSEFREIEEQNLSEIKSGEQILSEQKLVLNEVKDTMELESEEICEEKKENEGSDVKKTIVKKTKERKWYKMTYDLFNKMLDYEKEHPDVKQCDLQNIFNVNRSTYWRWKKKYNIPRVKAEDESK